MKKNTLQLSIPNPCSQNWADMSARSSGRFCSHCRHVVVDFSQMTDKELLHYFKNNPAVSCGRFDSSQLNRAIRYEEKKSFLPGPLKRMAATVAAVLALNEADAQVPPVDNNTAELYLCTETRENDTGAADEIRLSGEVKHLNGDPFVNARVSSPYMEDVLTDERGHFSLILNKSHQIPQDFTFSYDSMITVVRNYHPVMGTTSYAVTLYKYEMSGIERRHVMGVMLPPRMPESEFPSISFKNRQSCLSIKMKDSLTKLAFIMKENPFLLIELVAYPTADMPQQAIADKRINAITNYLVEALGISGSRILMDKRIGGGNLNRINIEQR